VDETGGVVARKYRPLVETGRGLVQGIQKNAPYQIRSCILLGDGDSCALAAHNLFRKRSAYPHTEITTIITNQSWRLVYSECHPLPVLAV
jgi:hypothetical protein